MSNSKKVIFTSLPFLIIGLIILIQPKFKEWQDALTLEVLESTPLKSSIKVSGEVVSSKRHTYSVGRFAVTDVGNLRLAFAELPFSGSSSSGVVLATDSTHSGFGGSTGTGARKFEKMYIPNGTQCKFGGMTFKFVGGKLEIDGKSIDATGPPTLVLIDKNRGVKEIRPLKVPSGNQAGPAKS